MDEEKLIGLEKLNQVELTEDERGRVLEFFAKLGADEDKLALVDTGNVERMVHVNPMYNIFREDVPTRQFSREDLLKGAPEKTDGYWQVPRLLE
ncbi:MAG: Asp-tRNA(Asn)/Glu-tRNA(Gln) amidotransferase subunit GatC [Bacillota bacterium]